MAKNYILYNKKAGAEELKEAVSSLQDSLQGETELVDILRIRDYGVFLSGLEPDDKVIIAGGDGTVNRFANETAGLIFDNDVLLYPCGTGNDFARDLGYEKGATPFSIKAFLSDLPVVKVNGKESYFINGVGYGIDGYCCEVGDEMKKDPKKKVNYTAIAIGGLLHGYRPTSAKICVDGLVKEYRKVWLAPTMNGRFYGGGMMPTPDQKRNGDGKVSLMVLYGSGKLKTLTVFPSIFQGKHIKHKEMVEIFEGREISVSFDRPVALQIDGETVLGVTEYSVRSCSDKASLKKEDKTAACARTPN